MNLFTTIAVEIGAQCNRTCWFCPNATNKRPDEYMDGLLLRKIGDELGSIKYSGRIALYIYNEPFKNPLLHSIINMFREKVPKSTIMVATNGDYVKNWENFQTLFDEGLNQLQINVYSNMHRFRKLSAMVQLTDAEEGNIYSNTSPKKRVYSVEQKFDRKLSPTSTKIGRFELSNRSGNVPTLPTLKEPLQKMCVRPFRSLQINWRGEAILCCNDYHADVVCGDVNNDTIQHIWEHSKVLKKYRIKLLRKNRKKLKLCKECSFNGGAYPHFIPKFWPELTEK